VIWWIAGAGVVISMFFLFSKSRNRSPNTIAPNLVDNLSSEEKNQFASDVRAMAIEGYERASKFALDDGKTAQFAYEVGILDAVYCVLANDNAARRNDAVRANMQMETVPFNRLDHDLGKQAVVEYLIWKFLPFHSDIKILNEAFAKFIKIVIENSKTDENPNEVIQGLIYSGRYDWQQLAQAAMNEEKKRNV
jgi:hypothetical protein